MNYTYSEPEGRRLLTPVNKYDKKMTFYMGTPYVTSELLFQNWKEFNENNPPLIYDGKLKLEVGKVYQEEMFVKVWQASLFQDQWENIPEWNIDSIKTAGFETRQVLTDAEPKELNEHEERLIKILGGEDILSALQKVYPGLPKVERCLNCNVPVKLHGTACGWDNASSFGPYSTEKGCTITFNKLDTSVKEGGKTFKCKGCGHQLTEEFCMRTPEYCYMCDPNVTVEELLSDEPIEVTAPVNQEDYIEALKQLIGNLLYQPIQHEQWFKDKDPVIKREALEEYIKEQIMLQRLM